MPPLGDPIPFRIRIGVLGVAGVEEALEEADPPELEVALAGAFELIPELLDAESRVELNRARLTELAHSTVIRPDDEAAARVVELAGIPDGWRRELAPDATGGARSAADRLIDECDVLLVVSGEPVSPGRELEALGEGTEISYAERRERPTIILPVRALSFVTKNRRAGIDARSIAQIEHYNTRDEDPEEAAKYARNVLGELFGRPGDAESGEGDAGTSHPGTKVPPESRRVVETHLVPHYTRASSIAKAYQASYQKTGLIAYTLSVTAVALVALGALVQSLSIAAFSLELLALLTIVYLIGRAHRMRAHARWLESRFLAERIRHGMHLVACGVRPTHHRIPPQVGGKEPPDLWMVRVFEEICSRLPELRSCDEESCRDLSDFVRGIWVGGQLAHHTRKRDEQEAMSRRLEMAGAWTFRLAVLAVAGHLLLLIAHEMHWGWPEPPWLGGGLTWLALVLPAAGAAFGGVRAQREYSRLAKRSAAMATALEDIQARLERVSSPRALESMLGQIERWMVQETQAWLMLLGPVELEAVG